MFFDENTGNYRYERKFLTDQLGVNELEHMVLTHPGCFSEVYHLRRVNNIYFDTADLRFFDDNVSGRSDRVKVRIRWYGSSRSRLDKPVLEIKIKKGLVGRKASYKMKPLEIVDGMTSDDFQVYFKNQELPSQVLEFLSRLEPVLINSYKRKYFLSFDNNYRFTIDGSMSFYDFRDLENREEIGIADCFNQVLELKYNSEFDEEAALIVGVLPIRVTKSSKYVSGVYSIRPDLAI